MSPTKTETELTDKEKAKAERAARAKEIEKREAELNKGREGKGTRVFVGMTRGPNPQMIDYEAFDENQPATLPKDITEFMDLYKKLFGTDINEPTIMSFLIDGFNSAQYSAASDPVSEFVEPTWSEDVKKQFRLVINNYVKATGMSIEESVNLIKPGIVASQQKLAAQSA